MDKPTERDIWLACAKLAPKHPWYFLRCLKTVDEHDPTGRKPYPVKAVDRIICRAYLEHPLLFIEKSRQIMMTWRMAGLTLWDAIHLYGRRHFFRSRKQEFADAILDRARLLYDNLADDQYPGLAEAKKAGDRTGTNDTLVFPKIHGIIQAVPQGSEMVVSYTSSGIIDDEMNLQPNFKQGYEQAFPTWKGGGRYCAVGTPNGHTYAWEIMYGIDPKTGTVREKPRLDTRLMKPIIQATEGDEEYRRRWIEHRLVTMPEDEFLAIPFDKLVASAPGIDYRVNCDGVNILSVHYSSDPDKSPETEVGRKWIANEKIGISPAGWLQQYEINYDSFTGRPVISNWDEHIFVADLDYDPQEMLYLSIDFGKHCVCIFAQVKRLSGFDGKQLHILDEVHLEHSNNPELIDKILERLEDRFLPSWNHRNIRVYCDPAGNQERETTADTDMNSSIKQFKAAGFKPHAIKFGVPESTRDVEAIFAMVYPDGSTAIKVHPRCRYLISCYEGGWRFPEPKGGSHESGGVKQGYPLKEGKFEHGGDATRYLCCNIFKPREIAQRPTNTRGTITIREKGSGRIIGRRRETTKVNTVNRRRGQHGVRRVKVA